MSKKESTILRSSDQQPVAKNPKEGSAGKKSSDLPKKRSLLEFAGCLTPEEANSLEKTIQEGRRIHRELHKDRQRRLWGEILEDKP